MIKMYLNYCLSNYERDSTTVKWTWRRMLEKTVIIWDNLG